MIKDSADSKIVAINKTAHLQYDISETYEAGMVLQGTEVKSIRAGKVNIKDSYAVVKNHEVFLKDMHISPYEQGNRFNHDPIRLRKLLLHKREIKKLYGKSREKGLSLIPLRVYLKNGKVKVELGVGRGKKLYDRRHDIKRREERRDIARAFKSKQVKV